MANRQHGRSRSPAGDRSPAGGRSPSVGRTVPVSRFPSGGWEPSGDRSPAGGAWTPAQPGTPGYAEPEVRRWPHPMGDAPAASAPEPALHYIRCALSYQNQLLADIKALLERLEAVASAAAEPKGDDGSQQKL